MGKENYAVSKGTTEGNEAQHSVKCNRFELHINSLNCNFVALGGPHITVIQNAASQGRSHCSDSVNIPQKTVPVLKFHIL